MYLHNWYTELISIAVFCLHSLNLPMNSGYFDLLSKSILLMNAM